MIFVSAINCGYHQLEFLPKQSPYYVEKIKVSIQPFQVNGPIFESEQPFRQSLEARILTQTTWQLVSSHQPSNLVFQGYLETFETRNVGLLGAPGTHDPSGSPARTGPVPFRREIRVKASMEIKDWQTGEVVFKMPCRTFSCQSNRTPDAMDSNCLGSMAEKFVDCFFAHFSANGPSALAPASVH